MTKTPITLVGFAGALAVAFGGAFALGSAADPIIESTETEHSASSSHNHEEQPVSPAAERTSAIDGYEVTLQGTPWVGHDSDLTFSVTKDDSPVNDLEPYLGAFGHLVSVRTGDLAYLHTRPLEEAHTGEQGGPDIAFATQFPTAGTYRLFLDFKHGGSLHTAEFTVEVS